MQRPTHRRQFHNGIPSGRDLQLMTDSTALSPSTRPHKTRTSLLMKDSIAKNRTLRLRSAPGFCGPELILGITTVIHLKIKDNVFA